MSEPFDQWTKAMEKMWAPWQQMISDAPWMAKPDIPFNGKWSAWVGAIRSTWDTNVAWWGTFMQQSEELFSRMYKESPGYSAAMEEQVRSLWDAIRKAQTTQQELIREQFEKMEGLLKEQEKHH